MNDWLIYAVPPIDERWDVLSSVSETIRRSPHPDNDQILEDWLRVKALATATEWDGKFTGAPCVFWIPIDEDFTHCFAWKGGSNGTCFIASRVRLDWLGVEPLGVTA